MNREFRASLDGHGWVGFSRSDIAPSLKQIFASLSVKSLRYRAIIPIAKSNARPNTLSSRFGLEKFPFHTDNVLHDVPPRYLVFVAPLPRAVATLIWDSLTLPFQSRNRAIFLLQAQTQQKYIRLEQPYGTSSIVRFNGSLMTPLNQEAKDAVRLIEVGHNNVIIDWFKYKIVVLDNWRMLHGRGTSQSSGIGKLHRFSAWI